MTTFACVVTAKSAAAISTIQISGDGARAVVGKIFRPAGGNSSGFEAGSILLGDVVDGEQVVDQVVVGCEGENGFSINCHGNPLIIEMAMELLRGNGAELISAEEMLRRRYTNDPGLGAIAGEAKLARLKAVTLEGVRIIANQVGGGLESVVSGWLDGIDSLSLADISSQCESILARSESAGLIIGGGRVVIAGPPNSGKSTLLNCLAGRQKAIVTDIAGTTRDWVGAECRIESLLMELIDTAGLDDGLRIDDSIDRRSQEKTVELLESCDLVLLVLDGSRAAAKYKGGSVAPAIDGRKVVVVLNKSDLGAELNPEELGLNFDGCVRISAREDRGIDELIDEIRTVLGVADFDVTQAVCFTERQRRLLGDLGQAKDKRQVKSLITELLNAQACV